MMVHFLPLINGFQGHLRHTITVHPVCTLRFSVCSANRDASECRYSLISWSPVFVPQLALEASRWTDPPFSSILSLIDVDRSSNLPELIIAPFVAPSNLPATVSFARCCPEIGLACTRYLLVTIHPNELQIRRVLKGDGEGEWKTRSNWQDVTPVAAGFLP